MAYYGKVEISGVNTANLPVLRGKGAVYKMQGRGRSCPSAADRGEFAAGA